MSALPDSRQAVRLRRFSFAVASYGIGALLIVIGVWAGAFPLDLLTGYALVAILINGIVYAVFRSGLNLRASDPSLTAWQVLAASMAGLYVAYHAGAFRASVLTWLLVVFMFGLFRLSIVSLLKLAAIVMGGYGALLWFLHWRQPQGFILKVELFQWAVLATTFVCFAVVGGYISELRNTARRNEERFRSLTALSSDWYWEQDENLRFVEISTDVKQAAGSSVVSHIGKTRWELPTVGVSDADWAQHRTMLEARLPLRDFEFQRVNEQGETIWLSVSGDPVFDGAGRFKGYRGIGRNITERKRAEDAVRESEARFRGLTELSSDWYWEQDTNFRNVYASNAVEARGGMAMPLRVGKTRWELPHTGITEQQWAEHRAQLERHESFRDLQYGRVGENGETVWFSVNGEPIFDARGRFAGYRGTGRNITERKRAEDALRASEERFRAIFEHSSAGIALWGADRICLAANAAYLQFVGYGAEELIGKVRFGELTAPADKEGQDLIRRALAGELPHFERDRIYVRGDGTQRWARSSVAAVHGPDARLQFVISIVTDITEAREAREHINMLNERLEERVRLRTAELETLVKELETFTYTVAHDLRTPLGVMSNFAGMVEHDFGGVLPEEGKRMLRRISDNAVQMLRLLEDLLAFARLGHAPVARARVAMHELAIEALRELSKQRANEGGTAPDLRVEELPACTGDRALLKQIWTQLLSNALKYSRTSEKPCIEAGFDAAQGAYYVRDNGVGFDMQHAGKLFGVFQRLHDDPQFDGTGMGLAIVQRIVQRHGGRIWAEAHPGEGAAFLFTLGA